MRLSLRSRLVIQMLAAIVPLAGLFLGNALLSQEAAVNRATEQLTFAASLVAANQDRVVDSARQMLVSIASMPSLVSGKTADCQRYFKTVQAQFPVYANVGIIGLDGYFLCRSADTGSGVFLGDRDYFQDALARRSFVGGAYVQSRLSGKSIVLFALPIIGAQGKASAVAVLALDLGEMAKAVINAALPHGGQVVILDRQGVVLAASPRNSEIIGQRLPSPALQAALKTMRPGQAEGLDERGRQRVYSFLPAGQAADGAFFVAVSVDKKQVLAPARQQLGLELIALALVALLGGVLAWQLGGRVIVAPAAALLEAVRQVRKGRLEVRIALDSPDDGNEFSSIAAGFNLMAESLQQQRQALQTELAHSQAAHEKLCDAQRVGRIGYWQKDLTSQKIWCSEEVFELLGVTPANFDGSPERLIELIHPGDRDAFKAASAAAAQAARDARALDLDLEFRVITPAGQVRWIHLFGRSHVDAQGQPTARRSGVIQDITQRKLTEQASARSIELLKRTGSLARVGGWELALDTLTPYWSQEIYHILELQPAAALGVEGAINFHPPEVRPVMRAALQAALAHGTPWDMELALITARGRAIRIHTQGHVLVEDGKVTRLFGVMQDISAQHAAQAHLRLLQTCIGRLNDMVVITGPMTASGPKIVFVNDAFERLTGFSREEVMGKAPAFMRGAASQPAAMKQLSVALRAGQAVRTELINYTKSGRAFWLEIDIVPVLDAGAVITHFVAVERDITERKRAEQALVDSEQRYAALFASAPVPMWVCELASARFLTVNQAAQDSYGYDAEEFLAMTLFDIRPPAEHARLRQRLDEGMAGQRTAWLHQRKDGSVFPVAVVSQPITYAGRAARFTVALDMSAQVQAEEAVQQHLFMLQRAADAAQAITWQQTLEGTLQEIADQARGVIGAQQALVSLSRGQGQGQQALHALSPPGAQAGNQADAQAASLGSMASTGAALDALVLQSGRALRLTQAELQAHPRWQGAPAAATKPCLGGWLAVPLTGRQGQNIGLLRLSDKRAGEFTRQDEYVAIELAHLASAAIENTRLLEEVSRLNAGLEQKVAERTAELARQEALFRALAEQAPQAVWTASPEGGATYYNRAWFELMGGEFKDWAGYRWLGAVHPEDVAAIKARWASARANFSPYSGTRRFRVRDGCFHTMSYRASPVRDDQGRIAFWVGIDADITELKASEAALRLSNQELEAFSYSVSHDLRAPLNTVDGFSRLLAKRLAGAADDKVLHYLARIQAGVAQMGRLIEDLLSLSQLTRTQLRCEPLDLTQKAASILAEWHARQPERQVAVSVQPGLRAEGDIRLVRVALENLLANAWKFTSQQARADIRVGQRLDAAGQPVFFVCDNGAGFDMAYADKLFTPFQRLHAASEFPGTGVGLAIVSRVIERHGGQLWAESAPGCGATFFFTLPRLHKLA